MYNHTQDWPTCIHSHTRILACMLMCSHSPVHTTGHMYILAHGHTHVHIQMYAHVHTIIHARVWTHTLSHVYTHIYEYIFMNACMCTHTLLWMHTRAAVHAHLCMLICARHPCTPLSLMHLHSFTHTYIHSHTNLRMCKWEHTHTHRCTQSYTHARVCMTYHILIETLVHAWPKCINVYGFSMGCRGKSSFKNFTMQMYSSNNLMLIS